MNKMTKLAFTALFGFAVATSFGATSTLNALKGSDTVVTEEADAAALAAIADLGNTYATDAELAAASVAGTNYTDSAIEALDLANTYEAKGTAAAAIEALDLANTYEAKGTAAAAIEALDLPNTYAAKATTLAGYGIADAKIENGVITLGSATITPLTAHQDISGKVDQSKLDTAVGDLADLAADPTFQEVKEKVDALVNILQALKTPAG